MEENSATKTKQTYKYIASAPPNELIDSTTFVLNFTERKFIHIGLDPENQFNVAVHIITRARHISISHEYLTRIYSLMGNILSFILETPDKTRNIIFLTDEIIKLSNMVYRGQSMLVVESKIKDGCRVLLNREDLLTLQNIEWSIFETVVRKSTKIRHMVLRQLHEISVYFRYIADEQDMYNQIRDEPDEILLLHLPKTDQCFYSQLKLRAFKQIAERCTMMKRNPNKLKVFNLTT